MSIGANTLQSPISSVPQPFPGLIYSDFTGSIVKTAYPYAYFNWLFKNTWLGIFSVNVRLTAGESRPPAAISAAAQQSMRVEQRVDDLGIPVQAAADGGGDR